MQRPGKFTPPRSSAATSAQVEPSRAPPRPHAEHPRGLLPSRRGPRGTEPHRGASGLRACEPGSGCPSPTTPGGGWRWPGGCGEGGPGAPRRGMERCRRPGGGKAPRKKRSSSPLPGGAAALRRPGPLQPCRRRLFGSAAPRGPQPACKRRRSFPAAMAGGAGFGPKWRVLGQFGRQVGALGGLGSLGLGLLCSLWAEQVGAASALQVGRSGAGVRALCPSH